jgi:hypothetical protein
LFKFAVRRCLNLSRFFMPIGLFDTLVGLFQKGKTSVFFYDLRVATLRFDVCTAISILIGDMVAQGSDRGVFVVYAPPGKLRSDGPWGGGVNSSVLNQYYSVMVADYIASHDYSVTPIYCSRWYCLYSLWCQHRLSSCPQKQYSPWLPTVDSHINNLLDQGFNPRFKIETSFQQYFHTYLRANSLVQGRYVTITIRNKTWGRPEWNWSDKVKIGLSTGLSRIMQEDSLRIVVIPDYEDGYDQGLIESMFPGLEFFTLAAEACMSNRFRISLYENAFFNIVGTNGPSVLALFGSAPLLFFVTDDLERRNIDYERFVPEGRSRFIESYDVTKEQDIAGIVTGFAERLDRS